MERLRAKSIELGELFIDLGRTKPRGPRFRDCFATAAGTAWVSVSLRHDEGYAIVQALIAEGVIGDFRAPDILRFGFAPAYLRYVDVFDAVATLGGIMERSTWDSPGFRRTGQGHVKTEI